MPRYSQGSCNLGDVIGEKAQKVESPYHCMQIIYVQNLPLLIVK